MVGLRLLHYAIVEKLGEGGMGVVYKAHDTHLDRFAAIKVLPPDRVTDEERKRRFIQEARAASALNHPNIVTIYDIATDHGTTFIAMEFVAGKSLAEVIPRHGLPLAQVLNYAVQIADGLARAHQAGIIHRDLKPGNIMIGDDGRARILDFGLAKLVDPSPGSTDATGTLTKDHAPRTEEGIVVGTVAYMSPEQAEGRNVDRRTDIFAFGVLLYEMLTGHKPFSGQSRLETLSAILKESPKPLSEAAPGIPVDLERLVDRSLRKDPDRRWQNVADVRVALLDLKDQSDSGRLTASSSPARIAAEAGWKRWAYVAAGVIVAAAVAGWLLQSKPQQSAQDLQPIPLTAFKGDERDPAFSPDGNQIAFSWGPEGGVTNTYMMLIGAGEPAPLTDTPITERMSQWSPDAKWIAIRAGNQIVVVPALPGGQRQVVTTSNWRPTWTPDSKYLLAPDGDSLYLAPLAGGERTRLIGPMEQNGIKYRAGPGAVSPDGRTLAFSYVLGNIAPLYLVSLGDDYIVQGQPRLVTPAHWRVPSWSWTPDSKAVIAIREVSDANMGGDSGMYRIVLFGGEPQRLDFAGDNPWYLDVARSGNRLAYTRLRRDVNLYRAELAPDGTLRGPGTVIASSSRREYQPAYSEDGSHIAFASNRSGSDEIWTADRNGANLVRLTNSPNPDGTFNPTWSPEGTRIAYMARPAGEIGTQIFVIPATGGAAQRLTHGPAVAQFPAWSRDGKWIYFWSTRGVGNSLWKVASTGGTAVEVGLSGALPPGIRYSFGSPVGELPDGRWLYTTPATGRGPGFWQIASVPLGGGQPQVLGEDQMGIDPRFAITDRGIYYLSPSPDLRSATLRLLPLAGGEPRTLGTISGTIAAGLAVAPDHSSILYSQCDQCAADIMLVENFK